MLTLPIQYSSMPCLRFAHPAEASAGLECWRLEGLEALEAWMRGGLEAWMVGWRVGGLEAWRLGDVAACKLGGVAASKMVQDVPSRFQDAPSNFRYTFEYNLHLVSVHRCLQSV